MKIRCPLHLAAGLAVSATAHARPTFSLLFGDQGAAHYSQSSGQEMATVKALDGNWCACAPGWLNNDRIVRCMTLDGPAAGAVFELPGAPQALPGSAVVSGPGGMIAYKTFDAVGRRTIAVVGPIEGPGLIPPVALVTGLNVSPNEPVYDFAFDEDGDLHAAVLSPGPGRRYNLFECFPQQWAATAYGGSNVQCETLTVKIGRIEFTTRGAGLPHDDVVVLAGRKPGSPTTIQVAALMRSNPGASSIIEQPGVLSGVAVANGQTYLAVSNIPNGAEWTMMRVMDGATPVGPDVGQTRACCSSSGLATGRRCHKPFTSPPPPPPPPPPSPPPSGSGGGPLGPGLAVTMFDDPVILESIRVGATFQGKVIASYGFNSNNGLFDVDETGDWRGHDMCGTLLFTDGSTALLRISDIGDGCPGDADGSMTVTFADVTASLAGWGDSENPDEPIPVRGDSNFDGVVTFSDITTTLANFGNDCR